MRRAVRRVSGALTGARTGWRGPPAVTSLATAAGGGARGFRFRFCPLGPARLERAEPSPPPLTFWALLPGTSGSRFTRDPSASRTLSLSKLARMLPRNAVAGDRGERKSSSVWRSGLLLVPPPTALPSRSLNALEVQPPQCRFHSGQQRSHATILKSSGLEGLRELPAPLVLETLIL